MPTTPERIRNMGREFSSLTDEQLAMFIEDAALEVSSLNTSEQNKERLTRYLAAHLASVNIRRIVKEKVDVLERTYSDIGKGAEGLGSTPFGQEYQRIVSALSIPGRKTLNLTVL
ncbi:DUF4054 domain-containing protein [Acinetobacter baumannii]|uniref:DUF4054 domain-containing protein n=1 Tax=Acinetobacter baumannii TaxID=470 RepID=UPI00070945B3|nr:DUF4054 domain-containing protein [Acinetobacter baumannii]KRI88047.1 hypothetical protein APC20_17810 [Acinetobacter baumannii]